MSADNYWMIRKDIHNFFVPLMGFASEEENPIVSSKNPRFNTIKEAVASVIHEDCEYGIVIHNECFSDEPVELIANESGHYKGCQRDWNFLNKKAECSCLEISKDWAVRVEPTLHKKVKQPI
jgi:hypothetical protein